MYVFVPWQRPSEYDSLLVLLFEPVVSRVTGNDRMDVFPYTEASLMQSSVADVDSRNMQQYQIKTKYKKI
jgi:hypothetical protein